MGHISKSFTITSLLLDRAIFCPGDYDDGEGEGPLAFAPQCLQGSIGFTPPPSPESCNPFNDMHRGFSANNPFANMKQVDSIPGDVPSDSLHTC